jgi:Bacterial Ig-like domain (group 3)/Domain of unknown function (DUF4214)
MRRWVGSFAVNAVAAAVLASGAIGVPLPAGAAAPREGTVPSTLGLTVSSDPARPGQRVLVLATVTGADGGTPTGTVTVRWARDPGDPQYPQTGTAGTATLDANGEARVLTVFPETLPAPDNQYYGLHVDASYPGDATYTSTGTQLQHPAATHFEFVFSCCAPHQALGQFVTNVYLDVLFRGPDPDGFGYWFEKLVGRAPLATLPSGLLFSDEWHAMLIVNSYQHLLHRDVDGAAFDYWLQQLRAGMHLETFQALLAGSPEYFELSGGGSTATVDTWVDALYADILERPADPAGHDYYAGLARSGTPRPMIAAALLYSTESLGAFVSSLYHSLLLRSGDDAGVAYWVDQVRRQGAHDETVIANIIGSLEFFTYVTGDFPTQPSDGAHRTAPTPSGSRTSIDPARRGRVGTLSPVGAR